MRNETVHRDISKGPILVCRRHRGLPKEPIHAQSSFFAISGSNDRIVPPQRVHPWTSSVSSTDTTYIEAGTKMDFPPTRHLDLIMGDHAPAEIHQPIIDWLNTRMAESNAQSSSDFSIRPRALSTGYLPALISACPVPLGPNQCPSCRQGSASISKHRPFLDPQAQFENPRVAAAHHLCSTKTTPTTQPLPRSRPLRDCGDCGTVPNLARH